MRVDNIYREYNKHKKKYEQFLGEMATIYIYMDRQIVIITCAPS